MRNRITVTLLLLILLATMAMPLVGAAEGDKAVIKEMVQAPSDYSVSLMPWQYLMHYAERYYDNTNDFPRHEWFDYRFYRLSMPRGPAPN